ncbi:ATP-dependent helicase [Bacillus cereus]|nr:ATP-dependent helicase [Bacillus cereus]MDA1994822.1 ATP-dependent helicase [Bacillus cereus]MDA2000942.1 ATP-dependent helicase [Bacillus cereus]MDA3654127.1 ATP-dependent helicase [Bacillus cereus]
MIEDKMSREQIIKDGGNILVTAGAGSGKTTILVSKIEADLKGNKTHYSIAAVTFTNKAAKEIEGRLGYSSRGNFIGTNDGFVEAEIIRPFIKDAFGNDYPDNFTVEYFDNQFASYEEGLQLLKYQNILGTYSNHKKNFKFQLALDILKRSLVARQYMFSKYFKIFIDEYQDSDKDMHNLFMYLKDQLKIKLFIVGDPKQSIYIWRGAEPENFNGLIENSKDFNKYNLTSNFRCCQDIQNYANLFNEETRSLIKEQNEVQNVISIAGDMPISDILLKLTGVKQILKLDEELVILVRRRDQAVEIMNELNEEGFNFIFIPQTPLDRATPNATLLKEVIKYVKNDRYSIYDLAAEIVGNLNPREIREIQKIINELLVPDINQVLINQVLMNLFAKLEITLDTREIEAFTEVMMTNEFDIAFDTNEYLHKIFTVHSAKGLEFNQVIITASDYKVHYNIDTNEHYVATTRAKDKLIVIMDNKRYSDYIEMLIKELKIKNIIKSI